LDQPPTFTNQSRTLGWQLQKEKLRTFIMNTSAHDFEHATSIAKDHEKEKRKIVFLHLI
jgi:hypothetical protein